MFRGEKQFIGAWIAGVVVFPLIQIPINAQPITNAVASVLQFDDYSAARRAFADGQWAIAERWLGVFVVRNPTDPRLVTAILMQAQAQIYSLSQDHMH